MHNLKMYYFSPHTRERLQWEDIYTEGGMDTNKEFVHILRPFLLSSHHSKQSSTQRSSTHPPGSGSVETNYCGRYVSSPPPPAVPPPQDPPPSHCILCLPLAVSLPLQLYHPSCILPPCSTKPYNKFWLLPSIACKPPGNYHQ